MQQEATRLREGREAELRAVRHALRNDLTVVVGTLDLVLDEPDLPPGARARLNHVQNLLERVADRLNALG